MTVNDFCRDEKRQVRVFENANKQRYTPDVLSKIDAAARRVSREPVALGIQGPCKCNDVNPMDQAARKKYAAAGAFVAEVHVKRSDTSKRHKKRRLNMRRLFERV